MAVGHIEQGNVAAAAAQGAQHGQAAHPESKIPMGGRVKRIGMVRSRVGAGST
jgi:hypothetical protein